MIESSSDDDSAASFKENVSSNIKKQNNKRKFNDIQEINPANNIVESSLKKSTVSNKILTIILANNHLRKVIISTGIYQFFMLEISLMRQPPLH